MLPRHPRSSPAARCPSARGAATPSCPFTVAGLVDGLGAGGGWGAATPSHSVDDSLRMAMEMSRQSELADALSALDDSPARGRGLARGAPGDLDLGGGGGLGLGAPEFVPGAFRADDAGDADGAGWGGAGPFGFGKPAAAFGAGFGAQPADDGDDGEGDDDALGLEAALGSLVSGDS